MSSLAQRLIDSWHGRGASRGVDTNGTSSIRLELREFFMSQKPENHCLGTTSEQVRTFLKGFGCRLVETSAMEDLIRGIANARGEDWPWVEKWFKEEGPLWVNDMETLFFEPPLENLTGSQSLNFTQQVWMLQPSVFEYQVWAGRAFVRMWWDRNRENDSRQ